MIRRYINIVIGGLFLCMVLLSCEKQAENAPQQQGVKARLSLAVLGFDSPNGTRAEVEPMTGNIIDPADPLDIVVKNIWFIQINTNDEIVNTYYNNDVDADPFVKIAKNSGYYKFIYVANTFNPELFPLGSFQDKNVSELMSQFKTLTTSNSCLSNNANSEGDSYPIMTGEIEQNINVEEPFLEEATLRYNVSKLTFVLKKDDTIPAEHVFKTIQLCNVPPRLYYAQSKSNLVEGGKYTNIDATDFIDDAAININDTDMDINGDGAKFTFYLPSNYQGEDSSITYPFDKGGATKPKATYVKIVAENKTDKRRYTYTYYLGANMTSDFNLMIGHHYVYNFTYWNVGAYNDHRVDITDL